MKISVLTLFMCAVGPAGASIAQFGGDIPGDGTIHCGTNAPTFTTCPTTFIGTVSPSAGSLTGALTVGGSILNFNLPNSPVPVFLTFAGGTDPNQIVGPLGLNPVYGTNGPADSRDVRTPITGQQITLNVKNTTGVPLASLDFFLEQNQTLVTSGFTPQNDGLSFGIRCTGPIVSGSISSSCNPATAPGFIELLPSGTGPTGLGGVNALDTNKSTPTFGDLLRFDSVNLAPGATGQFIFFLTDYKGTHDTSTGPTVPSGTFNLEIVPVAAPVPEPSTTGMLVIGCGVFLFRCLTRHRQN